MKWESGVKSGVRENGVKRLVWGRVEWKEWCEEEWGEKSEGEWGEKSGWGRMGWKECCERENGVKRVVWEKIGLKERWEGELSEKSSVRENGVTEEWEWGGRTGLRGMEVWWWYQIMKQIKFYNWLLNSPLFLQLRYTDAKTIAFDIWHWHLNKKKKRVIFFIPTIKNVSAKFDNPTSKLRCLQGLDI